VVIADAMEVSSFYDINRYSKEYSYHKTIRLEKEIIGMFMQKVREEDYASSQNHQKYQNHQPFICFDIGGDDISYDSSDKGNDQDKDRGLGHLIKDIDPYFQHFLSHDGRYRPQNSNRYQKSEISFGDFQDIRDAGLDI